jgi:universal stress protein A
MILPTFEPGMTIAHTVLELFRYASSRHPSIMSIIKNILLPTDFSSPSLAALDVAIALSLAHHAGLTLLHVHETTRFELPDGYVENMPSQLDRAYDELNHKLSELDQKARQAGVRRSETRVLQGSTVDTIVDVSRSFDYLVVGTHGRTGLARAVVGSVAQKVFERAHCPVVMVRPGTPAE